MPASYKIVLEWPHPLVPSAGACRGYFSAHTLVIYSPHFSFNSLLYPHISTLTIYHHTLLQFHEIQHISLLSCKSSHTLSPLIVCPDAAVSSEVFKIFLLCPAPSVEVQVLVITSVMSMEEVSSIMLPCDHPPLGCFFHEQLGFKMCQQLIVALAVVHSKLFRSNEKFRSSAYLSTLRQYPAAVCCGTLKVTFRSYSLFVELASVLSFKQDSVVFQISRVSLCA